MSDELKELQKISKILTLANSDSLEEAISKYATTDKRKKIWVLIDGINMAIDIIDKTSIKRRTVYEFLEVLENVKLIENPKRKPPIKLIDFGPASWIELLEETKPKEEKENEAS